MMKKHQSENSSHTRALKKRAVKTTIVGGQLAENERRMAPVPEGIEQLLELAAANSDIAKLLFSDRQHLLSAETIQLTPTEINIISAIDNQTLKQMLKRVKTRLESDLPRRKFLCKSAMTILATMGIPLLSGCTEKKVIVYREDNSQESAVPKEPDVLDKSNAPENMPLIKEIEKPTELQKSQRHIAPEKMATTGIRPEYHHNNGIPSDQDKVKVIPKSIVVNGDLEKKELLKTLRKHKSELARCHSKLKDRSDIKITASVEFSLTPEGRTKDIFIESGSKEEAFKRCLMRRLKRWQFPKKSKESGGASFSLTFIYNPDKR